MVTAIQKIKSGKTPGEDEIRSEMLKILTGERILWLTRVCQVAKEFDKTPRDWQTAVTIPTFKKGCRKQCTNLLLSLPTKVQRNMPNALKRNAENILTLSCYFSKLLDISLDSLATEAECLRKDSTNKLYLFNQLFRKLVLTA